MKIHFSPITIKKVLLILVACFTLSSCNYTIYYTNWHTLKVAKKSTYVVNYLTEIPDGAEAKISYTGKDKNYTLEHITGRWQKQVTLAPGQKGRFEVHIKTDLVKTLVSSLTVNGESITQQTQTGKNVIFRIAFELP
jgi:hypothetical protein